jgi:CheY-like chemotaxis protein/HPt (histidine-containing phosphotransfer) domain-containing protein
LGKGSTFAVCLPFEAAPNPAERPLADIADVDCVLVDYDAHTADLRAYLEHAGARVRPAENLAAAALLAADWPRTVVIHSTSSAHMLSPEALHQAFAGAPRVRHLMIVRGWGRRARLTAEDIVTLDGNCLRRATLLRAVAVAAGRASPEVLHSSPQELEPPPVMPTHAQARALHRLILIAEDDEVNQKVILRQMEILGYTAEIADNGSEALRLWRAGNYALLLSDLHMPDMDGYELAETIRREENERGIAPEQRMPILALTANAVRGEALRAQEIGMDEYLTKPLQLQQLKTALRKWLPREPGTETLPGELDPVSNAPAIDVQVLRSLSGPDGEVAREFLDDFLASIRRLAGELRNAYTADNPRQVVSIAHRLKASARAVGAMPLGDLCADLENSCRTGTRAGIAQAKERFEEGLSAVETQITRLLAKS